MKFCTVCKTHKPLSEFPEKWRNRCRECRNDAVIRSKQKKRELLGVLFYREIPEHAKHLIEFRKKAQLGLPL